MLQQQVCRVVSNAVGNRMNGVEKEEKGNTQKKCHKSDFSTPFFASSLCSAATARNITFAL